MSLVNTAIGRVFAAYIADDVRRNLLGQDGLRLAGAEPAEIFVQPPARGAMAARLQPGYLQRLAQIRAGGIDTALNKPIPGINTLAAPVFDHTGSICVVIAVMGPAGSFDSDTAGHPALTLLVATQRLSHRFGYMAKQAGS